MTAEVKHWPTAGTTFFKQPSSWVGSIGIKSLERIAAQLSVSPASRISFDPHNDRIEMTIVGNTSLGVDLNSTRADLLNI
jgi:hypothetical protein